MKATKENLIALGVGYNFDGKKTLFNLEELLERFQGASYHESDVKELPTEDGLSSVQYIDVEDVDFENAQYVKPEVVEEKEETVVEETPAEVVEDKTPIEPVEEKPKSESNEPVKKEKKTNTKSK